VPSLSSMTTPTDPPARPDPAEGTPQWGAAGGQPAAAPPGWGQPGGPPTGPSGFPGGPPAGWGQQGGPRSSEDTTWALLAHLSVLVLGFVGPLVVYLVKKDSSPFVKEHAAEALNWAITLTIATVVSVVLIVVLIGILLLMAIGVAALVFAVLAAIAANNGQSYRYPMTLRLVS
jgi:uncharacterized protein